MFAGALICATLAALIYASPAAAESKNLKVLWKLGKPDASYSDFSTKPAKNWMVDYPEGTGGRFILDTSEKLKKDVFPGLQAGPDDGFGGLRERPLDILFNIDNVPSGGCALTVGFAGVWRGGMPLLEASLNGDAVSQAVPRGGDPELVLSFPSNTGTNVATVISYYFPSKSLKKGANRLTLTIKEGSWLIYDFIKLEAAEDSSKFAVMELRVDSPPYLVKRGDGYGRVIRAKGVFLGAETSVELKTSIGGTELKKDFALKPGVFNLELSVPEQKSKTTAKVSLTTGGEKLGVSDVELGPVRHLKIYLIAHSHLDIGYPDLQSNILIDQKRYLEQAMDIADRRDREPMKWTAEISWLQWMLNRNIGLWEEYGNWLPETPLTRSVPDSFYKEYLYLRNIAYKAKVTGSSSGKETLNERHAVDGSPIGWNSVVPASRARIELKFPKPEKIEYVAVRDGRELEDNPIRYFRLKLSAGGKLLESSLHGPMGADRERLLVPVGGKNVDRIVIEIISARYDDRPVGIMEVEAYRKADPAETRSRFLAMMKDGRIELTSMYMNFLTQLTPTEWLIRSFLRSNEVAREAGVKLKTALMTDVPGFTFALPDVLSGAGIKYFYPALNADHAKNCLKGIPRAFEWEGPGGGKIIVYHSFESYMEGWNYGFTLSADDVERRLPAFLDKLDAENYVYDVLPFRTLGDTTDDGPVAELLPEVVEDWNSRWAFPKMVIGTPSEFFGEFDGKYGKSLPLLKGDWTSSWEDGEGSTSWETILARTAHRDQLLVSAMAAFSDRLLGGGAALKKQIETAEEDIYLYDEHTWGADMSVRQPFNLQTLGQWDLKKLPAWELPMRFEAAKNLLGPLTEKFAPRAKHGGTILAVMNASGVGKSDYVRLPAAAGKGYKVYDTTTGKAAASTIAAGADGKPELVINAAEVPGVGIKYYEVVAVKGQGAQAASPAPETLENKYYKITLDGANCRVTSIFDKQAGQEIVDAADGFAMNEFVYVLEKSADKKIRMECTGAKTGAPNGLYSEVVFTGKAKNFPLITQRIRLYDNVKRIEFVNRIDKQETLETEAVYFAFPMRSPGGVLKYDMTGGVMESEKDQLQGAMRDWISMQDAAAAVGDQVSVLFSTPDAPLVVPEEIRILSYREKMPLKNTTLFSYIMNNYWHTNYKASQGGAFTFRYAITSVAGRAADSEIVRFGSEYSDPLVASWVKKGGSGAGKAEFISVSPANVRLLGVKTADDGNGIIVRLQEMDGKKTPVKVTVSPLLKAGSAVRTNLLEEGATRIAAKRAQGGGLLIEDTIGPRGMLTIRIK